MYMVKYIEHKMGGNLMLEGTQLIFQKNFLRMYIFQYKTKSKYTDIYNYSHG